ncbi:MAG: MoxR family ATPase [Crocosphaera sp.]|nr:MoxR family ATPase [Crocosphaera sp.]
MSSWKIFQDHHYPHCVIKWPDSPPWRRFAKNSNNEVLSEDNNSEQQCLEAEKRGKNFILNPAIVETVNAAIYLRRPILVTGKPGTGKTTLAYAIAYQLQLKPVLLWPINTRTTLQDGLYYYDAIARLQDAQLDKEERPDIGHYIRLGPLGTAMYPSHEPRVLLIDEIDKCDIDLPNDLLNLFEEGSFEITEISRLFHQKNAQGNEHQEVEIKTHDGEFRRVSQGEIPCQQFPIVIMTSNGERDFPLPFKRRCLSLFMEEPKIDQLTKIVKTHFDYDEDNPSSSEIKTLLEKFINLRDDEKKELATDQLLNVIFMLLDENKPTGEEKDRLIERLLTPLTETGNK